MFLHRKCKLHTLALLKWNGCFHDNSSESVSLRHLCCFQIDRTVFSPLLTQFLSPIQLHRITWFFRGTKRFTISFCSCRFTTFTEIVSKVKIEWQRQILPKIKKLTFSVDYLSYSNKSECFSNCTWTENFSIISWGIIMPVVIACQT